MSTDVLPQHDAPDGATVTARRRPTRPSAPAMPMVRCAACDAPNVDDRVTCWRCLRDLDADASAVEAVARIPESAVVVRTASVADPVGERVAGPIAGPGGERVAGPIARPAARPIVAPVGERVPGLIAEPVALPIASAPRISVSVRAPAPTPRPIVLTPWPSARPARRGGGRALIVASIAMLLVIGVVGVTIVNLTTGGPTDGQGGSRSQDGGLLAAAPADASAEPTPEPTPEPTEATVVEAPSSEPAWTEAPNATRIRTDPPLTFAPDVLATQVATEPRSTASTGEPAARALRGNAFTCGDSSQRVRDLRDRTWRVTKVSFRIMAGFERVVLHLERIGEAGPGRGTVAIAGRVSTRELAELPGDVHPERARRGLLRIALPGVPEGPEIRAYRPIGIGSIGELSLLPGRDSRTALLTIDHDACYRIRVPEWGQSGTDEARRAEVVIDIRD